VDRVPLRIELETLDLRRHRVADCDQAVGQVLEHLPVLAEHAQGHLVVGSRLREEHALVGGRRLAEAVPLDPVLGGEDALVSQKSSEFMGCGVPWLLLS